MKVDKTIIILGVIVVAALAVTVGCYYVDNYVDDDDSVIGNAEATPETLLKSLVVGEYMEYELKDSGVTIYKKLTVTAVDVTETGVEANVDEYTKMTYGGQVVAEGTIPNVWDSEWVAGFADSGSKTIKTIDGKQNVSVWTSTDCTLCIGDKQVIYVYTLSDDDTSYPLKKYFVPGKNLMSSSSSIVVTFPDALTVTMGPETLVSGETYTVHGDPTFAVTLPSSGTAFLRYVSESDWGPSSGSMSEFGRAGTVVYFPICLAYEATTTTVTITFTGGN